MDFLLNLPLFAFGASAVAFYVCWMCYVCVMVAARMKREGKLTTVLKIAFFPALVIGGLLDIALNFTIGLALGIKPLDRPTLSAKMRRIRQTQAKGWRLAVARFVCVQLLNPFDDEEHC